MTVTNCYCKDGRTCWPHQLERRQLQLGLREREGDQPLPTTATNSENVSEAVKRDLDARIALGIQRYGKPLQTFNGRDALRDAYEEALDLVHYLKQAIMERDATK